MIFRVPGIYCGPPPDPSALLLRWNLDPVLLLTLAALAVALRRSRAGLLGVGVLALAFVSPLCALSSALFSAREVHHVLLVAVAAPLLALAGPPPRRPGGGVPALLALTLALWAWHAPRAYDLALSDMGVYWVMQGSLLAAAWAFWRVALAPGAPGALLLILGAWVQMGLLGALLTFAPVPLYAAHAVAPWAWGLAPLDDQRLGGLIMWVPAGLPFAAWGALVARRGWLALGGRPA